MQMTLFQEGGLFALAQVLMIDVVLAGDNAVVIGLAAARVPVALPKKVIFWGLVAAVILRIAMAAVAVQLLAIIGLTLAGGILLLWVCWRMWRDISGPKAHDVPQIEGAASARRAILQILVADLSMSLDNVLAVAGAAREHPLVLALGLLLSVGLMGVAASWIARLLQRFRWIGYIGLAIVLYVALHLMWEGHRDVVRDLGWVEQYNRIAPAPLDITGNR